MQNVAYFVGAWSCVSQEAISKRFGQDILTSVSENGRFRVTAKGIVLNEKNMSNLTCLRKPQLDRLCYTFRDGGGANELHAAANHEYDAVSLELLQERFFFHHNGTVSPKVHPDRVRIMPSWRDVAETERNVPEKLMEEIDEHVNADQTQNVLVVLQVEGPIWYHSGRCMDGVGCPHHVFSTEHSFKREICQRFATLAPPGKAGRNVEFWSSVGMFFMVVLNLWPPGANWRLIFQDDGSTYYQQFHTQVGVIKEKEGPRVPREIIVWKERRFGDRLTCTEPMLPLMHANLCVVNQPLHLWSRLQVCRSCTNLLGLIFVEHSRGRCQVYWDDPYFDAPIEKRSFGTERALLVVDAE